MKCKKHCPCYEKMLESRRIGAQKTNANYTKEQRSKAAKKAWKKRAKKKIVVVE